MTASQTLNVLKQAGMESIHAMLLRSQLRWAGHVARMPDERLLKQRLYGELCRGKRSKGGQKKRYRDTLQVSMKRCCIDPNDWRRPGLRPPSLAQQSSIWCQALRGATHQLCHPEAYASQRESTKPTTTRTTATSLSKM